MPINIRRSIEERKSLDEITREHGVSKFIDYLPAEITVVESPFKGVDCEEYALGTSGIRHYLPDIFPEIDNPQQEDIVLYYCTLELITHVGRYQKDGSVISKWHEDGPVVKHPIDLVPLVYGILYFFQRIPESILERIKSPKALLAFMDTLDDNGYYKNYPLAAN